MVAITIYLKNRNPSETVWMISLPETLVIQQTKVEITLPGCLILLEVTLRMANKNYKMRVVRGMGV